MCVGLWGFYNKSVTNILDVVHSQIHGRDRFVPRDATIISTEAILFDSISTQPADWCHIAITDLNTNS